MGTAHPGCSASHTAFAPAASKVYTPPTGTSAASTEPISRSCAAVSWWPRSPRWATDTPPAVKMRMMFSDRRGRSAPPAPKRGIPSPAAASRSLQHCGQNGRGCKRLRGRSPVKANTLPHPHRGQSQCDTPAPPAKSRRVPAMSVSQAACQLKKCKAAGFPAALQCVRNCRICHPVSHPFFPRQANFLLPVSAAGSSLQSPLPR